MKKFNDIEEAREWFRNSKDISKTDLDKIPFFWDELEKHRWKFGEWILFQHIHSIENAKSSGKITRPILAIFTGFKIWDQALVINFVEQPRAWIWYHEVITNKEIGYSMQVGSLDDEVEAIQFWTDNIHVMGHWKSKPSLGQLKEAMSRKIFYGD
jgi:hypothetical protein